MRVAGKVQKQLPYVRGLGRVVILAGIGAVPGAVGAEHNILWHNDPFLFDCALSESGVSVSGGIPRLESVARDIGGCCGAIGFRLCFGSLEADIGRAADAK